jgi:hypothetical protein
MTRCWDTCLQLDRTSVPWGLIGPDLLNQAVRELHLTGYAVDPKVFCPIDWREWSKVLDSEVHWQFDPMTRAVHLWNEMWRLGESSKDATYPADCLYEMLKRRYLT